MGLVAEVHVPLEEVFRYGIFVVLVVRARVKTEFVTDGILEKQLGVVALVELHVPVKIDKKRQIVVAALVPIGREVSLRELHAAVEGM